MLLKNGLNIFKFDISCSGFWLTNARNPCDLGYMGPQAKITAHTGSFYLDLFLGHPFACTKRVYVYID